jgi:hypothetical protein
MKCLVIGPFGPPTSEDRKRSDSLLKNVIQPVCESEGIKAVRDIDKNPPGELPAALMRELFEADLVIADLTNHNPNAFYELGIRHTTGRPTIHMAFAPASTLPFDIQTMNVISIELDQFGGWIQPAKDALLHQIREIKEGTPDFSSAAHEAALCYYQQGMEDCTKIICYRWVINYSPTLASDWLKHQSDEVRELIDQYFDGTKDQHLPKDSRSLDLLAEYMAYKVASGGVLTGQLYYESDAQGSSDFTGWAILTFTLGSEPITAQVHGELHPDGRIEMRFSQRERKFEFAAGIDGTIRGFAYVIEFKREKSGSLAYRGVLYHPDDPELVVAKTTLVKR